MSHAITAVLRTRLVLSSLNTQLPFSYTQSSALQRTTPVSVWARTPMLSALLERLWERVSSMQRPSLALSGAPAAVPDAWAAPSALEWDGLLLAAPKKKVSHSRKAMRAANKGLKDRVNLVHCPGCARPKLQHHLCEHCYGDLARGLKAAGKPSA